MICQTKYQVLRDIFDIDFVSRNRCASNISPFSMPSTQFNSHKNSSQIYSCWTLCPVTNNLSAELAGHVRQNVKKSENFLTFCKLWTFFSKSGELVYQLLLKMRTFVKKPSNLISGYFMNDGEILSICSVVGARNLNFWARLLLNKTYTTGHTSNP